MPASEESPSPVPRLVRGISRRGLIQVGAGATTLAVGPDGVYVGVPARRRDGPRS